MDQKLIEEIKGNLKSKTTEDLLAIWNEENRNEYSDACFESIRQLLAERGHNFKAKLSTQQILSIIENREKNGDRICTKCYSVFSPLGRKKRTSLGFPKYLCPRCNQKFLYTLSRRTAVIYSWGGVVLFILGAVIELWIALLVLFVIIALHKNSKLKPLIRDAWFKYIKQNQDAIFDGVVP